MYKKLAIIVILFFVGLLMYAEVSSPRKIYHINQVKPDGEIHKTYIYITTRRPQVDTEWSGHSYIFNGQRRFVTPPGWLLEIEYKGLEESNEK